MLECWQRARAAEIQGDPNGSDPFQGSFYPISSEAAGKGPFLNACLNWHHFSLQPVVPSAGSSSLEAKAGRHPAPPALAPLLLHKHGLVLSKFLLVQLSRLSWAGGNGGGGAGPPDCANTVQVQLRAISPESDPFQGSSRGSFVFTVQGSLPPDKMVWIPSTSLTRGHPQGGRIHMVNRHEAGKRPGKYSLSSMH